jgi:hypothetical protein
MGRGGEAICRWRVVLRMQRGKVGVNGLTVDNDFREKTGVQDVFDVYYILHC